MPWTSLYILHQDFEAAICVAIFWVSSSCGITERCTERTQQWSETQDLKDKVNPYAGGGATYWQESVEEVVQACWTGTVLIIGGPSLLMFPDGVFRSSIEWVSMTVMYHRMIL